MCCKLCTYLSLSLWDPIIILMACSIISSSGKILYIIFKLNIHNISRKSTLTKKTSYSPEVWLPSESGKNVAKSSILHSCVKIYRPPAYTHFENVAYSELESYNLYSLKRCKLLSTTDLTLHGAAMYTQFMKLWNKRHVKTFKNASSIK